MGDIIELCNEFKTEMERTQFIAKQHQAILQLMAKNKQLESEIVHLKELLVNSTPLLVSDSKVERIIVTPEEALIERQIDMIQQRAYSTELTLEDTKKLDLLIKNKRLAKEQSTTINGESKKVEKKSLTKAELILIASQKSPTDESP